MRAIQTHPALVCLGVLAIAASALAQVRQANVGQALDANYQIGSGGYNTVVGGAGGVNSQLYVNGQVTGLGSFRGNRNVVMDQLQMNVPSNGLSVFQQQSVGINDAINRNAYQASPYYSPSAAGNNVQSSLGAGGIGSPAGAYAPTRYIDHSVAQQLYNDATADYSSLMPSSPGSGVAASPMVSSSDGVGLPVLPMGAAPRRDGDLRPGASALFNSPVASNRDDLARELREIDRRMDNRVDALVTSRVDQTARGAKLAGKNDMIKGETNVEEGKDAQLKRLQPTPLDQNQADKAGAPLEEIPTITANQDIFLDTLVALRQAKAARGLAAPIVALPGEQPGQPDLLSSGTVNSSLKRPGVWKGQDQAGEPTAEPFTYGPAAGKARVEYVPGKGIVIHGLAGESSDLFNSQMTKAEDCLKQSEFYDAASHYHTASVLNPGNPLAWVGQGLSLFMAHEPSSAALSFQHGMQAFPPLMETRVDVASMFDVEKFKTQLTRLDQRLEKDSWENDAPLAYLAAYLHYCLGEDEIARNYASLLKVKGIKAPVMESFVEFLLSGQKPASQPAGQ